MTEQPQQPSPVRGVFFDVGGVLLRTEDTASRQKWEKRFGLPDWGLADAVFNSELSRRASTGQARPEEVWAQVGQQFGVAEAEMAEFQRDFWAGDRFDEPLIAYIASLRPRYHTAIISNAWPSARAFLLERDFISAAFEKIYISAELGVAKPDPRIYHAALDDLGLKPEEAVFVDDLSDNVAAAQSLGMAGIVYRPDLDVPAALASLGVR